MQKIAFAELTAEEQADVQLAAEQVVHSFPTNRSIKFGTVMVADGRRFTGANIRRRSYSSSTCAERMVVDQALYGGVQHLERLVIYGKNVKDAFGVGENGPCGLCRQILLDALIELHQDDLEILISDQAQQFVFKTSVNELMPLAYREKESEVV